MNFEPFRQAVTTAFQAGWKKDAPLQAQDLMPVAYENKPFSQPSGLPWCRFAIREGKPSPAALGRDFIRTPGFISVQIFLPEEKGTKDATLAIDKLAQLFDFRDLAVGPTGTVLFRNVEKRTIGKTGDGWYQINAMCDFQWDDIAGAKPLADSETGEALLDSETGGTFIPS